MKKDIIILSAAFFLIFLSFNTMQQYFAAIYSDFGKEKIAIYSLTLAYFFFWLGTFIAPLVLRKIGLKKSMIIASFGYISFIGAIPFQTDWIMMALSVLLGLCAALLWTAEGAYIIKATEEKSRATIIGIFTSAFLAGSFLGIFGASFLINKISFEALFFALAGIAALGTITLLFLKEQKEEVEKTDFKAVLKPFKTKAAFYFPLFALGFVVMGFFVTVIMLYLKELNGIEFAGRVASVYWLASIIGPLVSGFLADKIGKKVTLQFLAGLLLIGAIMLFSGLTLFIFTGAALMGFFASSVLNVGLSAISNVSKNKNEIAAFFQFSLITGGVFALIISGLISYQMALYITITVALVSLAALFFVKE